MHQEIHVGGRHPRTDSLAPFVMTHAPTCRTSTHALALGKPLARSFRVCIDPPYFTASGVTAAAAFAHRAQQAPATSFGKFNRLAVPPPVQHQHLPSRTMASVRRGATVVSYCSNFQNQYVSLLMALVQAMATGHVIRGWKVSAAVFAAMCAAPGSVVAADGLSIPATGNSWALGLSLVIVGGVVAAAILKSPGWLRTSGMDAKTGIAVPLPYRGTRRCIYLDYNATSPIFPEVSREMFPFIGECFGNPSSAHALGRACKAAVVRARAHVAALLGCAPEEVVFVGSGSEADNHAILASLALHAAKTPRSSPSSTGGLNGEDKSPVSPRAIGAVQHVVTSAIEHPAISKCLDHLAAEGKVEVTYVGVDREGRVSVEDVVAAFRPETALVTVMHSNNEVGSLQPIKEIAEACRQRGIMCHTDAAQSIGKVPVKVADLGVDMLTLVGHKFGAPKGVAALFVRRGLTLPPMVHGGGQEAGRRAGTENVLLISGMGKAAEIVDVELERLSVHLATMRARLLELLMAADLSEGVRVHGPSNPNLRLPNTLSIGIPGIEARVLLERLSETVAASAGSACHAGEATMSGVLQAMGVDNRTGFGTLRLSVGRHTTRREVDMAGAAIIREAKIMLADSPEQ